MLTDFGLGHAHHGFEQKPIDDTQQLRDDKPIRGGTPLYMAPECANGEDASQAADCYALGVMLYQLLCADDHPFLKGCHGHGWQATIVDPALRQLVADCVEVDPQRRITSAPTIAHRLRTLDQDRLRLEQARLRGERRRLRRMQMIAGISAVACGLIALLTWLTWQALQVSEQRRARLVHLGGQLIQQVSAAAWAEGDGRKALQSAYGFLEYGEMSELPMEAEERQQHIEAWLRIADVALAHRDFVASEQAHDHLESFVRTPRDRAELALIRFRLGIYAGNDDATIIKAWRRLNQLSDELSPSQRVIADLYHVRWSLGRGDGSLTAHISQSLTRWNASGRPLTQGSASSVIELYMHHARSSFADGSHAASEDSLYMACALSREAVRLWPDDQVVLKNMVLAHRQMGSLLQEMGHTRKSQLLYQQGIESVAASQLSLKPIYDSILHEGLEELGRHR
jgi:tetratricopeptide (TPR) repeat protein